jgi:CHRD domain
MSKLPTRSLPLALVPALFFALGSRPPAEQFTATLDGASEVPAVQTTATGTATFTLDGHELTWHLEVSGIDNPTMGHIHGGAPGENGGVLVPLFREEKGEHFSGVLSEGHATVEDAVIEAIRSGKAYVNVHTKANPRGEIRGQIEADKM